MALMAMANSRGGGAESEAGLAMMDRAQQMPTNGGLMVQAEAPDEEEGGNEDIDSKLIFELASKMLDTEEGMANVARTLQGAKDMATAIGKMAVSVLSSITDELDSRGMSVDPESLYGSSGGLTMVLAAIYAAGQEAGIELDMQSTLPQAYLVAEEDLDNLESGAGGQMV